MLQLLVCIVLFELFEHVHICLIFGQFELLLTSVETLSQMTIIKRIPQAKPWVKQKPIAHKLILGDKRNSIAHRMILCSCSVGSTCYCECKILSASVTSRASNNKTVRNRVSNSGNLFHLVKYHLISKHLYKETIIMNKIWCFLF